MSTQRVTENQRRALAFMAQQPEAITADEAWKLDKGTGGGVFTADIAARGTLRHLEQKGFLSLVEDRYAITAEGRAALEDPSDPLPVRHKKPGNKKAKAREPVVSRIVEGGGVAYLTEVEVEAILTLCRDATVIDGSFRFSASEDDVFSPLDTMSSHEELLDLLLTNGALKVVSEGSPRGDVKLTTYVINKVLLVALLNGAKRVFENDATRSFAKRAEELRAQRDGIGVERNKIVDSADRRIEQINAEAQRQIAQIAEERDRKVGELDDQEQNLPVEIARMESLRRQAFNVAAAALDLSTEKESHGFTEGGHVTIAEQAEDILGRKTLRQPEQVVTDGVRN